MGGHWVGGERGASSARLGVLLVIACIDLSRATLHCPSNFFVFWVTLLSLRLFSFSCLYLAGFRELQCWTHLHASAFLFLSSGREIQRQSEHDQPNAISCQCSATGRATQGGREEGGHGKGATRSAGERREVSSPMGREGRRG